MTKEKYCKKCEIVMIDGACGSGICDKEKLKTLKEIRHNGTFHFHIGDIRAEAVKWIKSMQTEFPIRCYHYQAFRDFFNLTEDDLK